jgi:hypothetical protein
VYIALDEMQHLLKKAMRLYEQSVQLELLDGLMVDPGVVELPFSPSAE